MDVGAGWIGKESRKHKTTTDRCDAMRCDAMRDRSSRLVVPRMCNCERAGCEQRIWRV